MSKRKQKKNTCAETGCRKQTREGHTICSGCDKKRWRKKYPMKAAYQTLKYNCTRRKIFFDLSFEEFAQFCYETDYMAGKGRSSESYSIDRRIEGKTPGYTFTNIQMLTKGQNSIKEHERRKKMLVYDWKTKSATVVAKETTVNKENPF